MAPSQGLRALQQSGFPFASFLLVFIYMSYFFHRAILLWLALFAQLLLAGCSPLSILNATLPSDTYRATPDIAYGVNARQRLDVYRPAKAPRAAPVVVFFYGGNWNRGQRGDYLFVGEALASKGFVAVVPDYRLYPEVRYPDFLDDSAQAVQWTMKHIAQSGGDPEQIFVMGHSAGAYNAAMLALNSAYLRAAGADRSGCADLSGSPDLTTSCR